MDFGQEFYFLSIWSLGVLSSISCLSAILETFVAPGNKQIHFLLARHHFVSFLYF